MKLKLASIVFLSGIMALAGCQQQAAAPPPGFAFDRGARLLSAGSPKSAIPFLTQTVAGTPDGPEPVALLALAYALDLQDERAILQVQQVHRPADSPPGWELVALGIAKMAQHHPQEAIAALRPIAMQNPNENPATFAAVQWLVLAEILNGDHDRAIKCLQALAKMDSMQTSALLWTALIHEQHGQTDLATAALVQCAKPAVTTSGQLALAGGTASLSQADDQTLYDAAICAIAAGDLNQAQELFVRVHTHTSDAGDTALWLSLLAGIKENWQTARTDLKEACDTGPVQSRGLASQLFSVVCALEDRPDDMIQYTLTGQRLMGRSSAPAYIHEQPKPEGVWFSDQMK